MCSKYVIGVALAFGIGIKSIPASFEMFPQWFKIFIGESSIATASIIAFTLNILFPKEKNNKGIKAKG